MITMMMTTMMTKSKNEMEAENDKTVHLHHICIIGGEERKINDEGMN
jgi:hypothetical protein